MTGRTLGNYPVLEPLGAGGMSEVFKARHAVELAIGRHVLRGGESGSNALRIAKPTCRRRIAVRMRYGNRAIRSGPNGVWVGLPTWLSKSRRAGDVRYTCSKSIA